MEKYLYCANCADILSGFHCYKLRNTYYCEECMDKFRKKLNENSVKEHCYNCDRALIYGDELFEEAEEFCQINDECYCNDCIDKFKIDIWDIYQEDLENVEEC